MTTTNRAVEGHIMFGDLQPPIEGRWDDHGHRSGPVKFYDPERDRLCPIADDGDHVWVEEAGWRCRECGIEREFGVWGPPDDPAEGLAEC